MKIQSREIYWCQEHDRYVLVVKVNDDEIIGLNYQQGSDVSHDEMESLPICEKLTDFYLSTWQYLSGEDELERINQAIWAHLSYMERRHERRLK